VLWQIVRYPNLYASIAATVNFIARQPRVFAEMLGKMMWWCGEDKIIYGGESPIWHPRWALEELWNFELPRDIVEQRGYPQLTEQAKRKILGEPRPPARDRRRGQEGGARRAELTPGLDLRRPAMESAPGSGVVDAGVGVSVSVGVAVGAARAGGPFVASGVGSLGPARPKTGQITPNLAPTIKRRVAGLSDCPRSTPASRRCCQLPCFSPR